MTTDFVIDLITALWLGFVGACIGSFLNVVAYRMPRGMSVVWKPSHCPRCGSPIRARDNVPVLGWLVLRGKCRDCGESISPRYLIVEAVMGVIFFLLAYVELFSVGANLPGGPFSEAVGALNVVWNPQWQPVATYASHCVMFSLLMCVVLCNRDQQAAPKSVVVFGLAAAAGLAVLAPRMHLTFLTPGTPVGALSDFVLGVLIGATLGRVAGRTACCAKIHCDNFTVKNLERGSCLVGTFLGWQSLVTLAALILVVLLIRLKNKNSCNPHAVDALFWLPLLQVLFWGEVSNSIFQ